MAKQNVHCTLPSGHVLSEPILELKSECMRFEKASDAHRITKAHHGNRNNGPILENNHHAGFIRATETHLLKIRHSDADLSAPRLSPTDRIMID